MVLFFDILAKGRAGAPHSMSDLDNSSSNSAGCVWQEFVAKNKKPTVQILDEFPGSTRAYVETTPAQTYSI